MKSGQNWELVPGISLILGPLVLVMYRPIKKGRPDHWPEIRENKNLRPTTLGTSPGDTFVGLSSDWLAKLAHHPTT